MPMVPTSPIVLILLFAFVPSASGFFLRVPNNRLLGAPTLLMVAVAAVMLFTLYLAIISMQIVWLSWALLGTAILLFAVSIPVWRRSRASKRARDRQVAERRARGH